jgi:hypothetical protein
MTTIFFLYFFQLAQPIVEFIHQVVPLSSCELELARRVEVALEISEEPTKIVSNIGFKH